MRRLLFAPAGMRDSSYAWDAAMAARSVHGHGMPDESLPGESRPGSPPQGLREAWDAALPIAERWRKPLAKWRYADAARQRAIVVATNATNGNVLYRRIVRASTGLDLLAFDV